MSKIPSLAGDVIVSELVLRVASCAFKVIYEVDLNEKIKKYALLPLCA